MILEPGIRGEQSVSVTAANTAKTMGSGTLDVFATPALVALAEKTCWMSVAPALAEGDGTVGTKLELEHTAPTPVGMTVTCESELVAVEGRKLTFKVSLHDEKGPVGGGTHERFVIHNDKFAAKAEAKKYGKCLPPRGKAKTPSWRALAPKVTEGVLPVPAAAAAGPRPAAAVRRGPVRPAAAVRPARWRGTAQNTSLCNPARPHSPFAFRGDSLPRSMGPDTLPERIA